MPGTVYFSLNNNDLGCITQMWMQNILEKSATDIYSGTSLMPHVQGLHNYSADYEFPGTDMLHERVFGNMMIKNCRLNLSDLFSELFTHCDPRGFGANLEIVIQLQDYPCVLGGIHEAIKYYNHVEGDGTTVDLRSSFQFDNLRIEIVQNEYIADPWASTYLKPRVHTITKLHPTTAAFAAATTSLGDHRIMFGQQFANCRNIRAVHFWYQILCGSDWLVGTTMCVRGQQYAGLNQIAFHDPNFPTLQTTWKLTQNGRTVFDLDTNAKLLENNRLYQHTTFGDIKNRPIPYIGHAEKPSEGCPVCSRHSLIHYYSTTVRTPILQTMERRIILSKLSQAILKI